jgi:hypothetical protein
MAAGAMALAAGPSASARSINGELPRDRVEALAKAGGAARQCEIEADLNLR